MGRVLCVDYGRRRLGLAVSDALGATAQPLEVVERTKQRSALQGVLAVVERVQPEEIVVGLPLRLDGSPGVAAQAAQQFADALRERSGLPVTLWDERLSTTEASRQMRSAGMDQRRQRGVVDKVAAAMILRSYLETRRRRGVDVEDMTLPEPIEAPHPEPGPPVERPGRRKPRRRKPSDRDGWRRELRDL